MRFKKISKPSTQWAEFSVNASPDSQRISKSALRSTPSEKRFRHAQLKPTLLILKKLFEKA